LFRIYLQQPYIAITHLGYFDIKEDNILSKTATFVNKFLHTDVIYTKKDLNLIQVLKIKIFRRSKQDKAAGPKLYKSYSESPRTR